MSEKMMAASSKPSKRSMGCSVTWVASAGVLQMAKKSCSSLTLRNSKVCKDRKARIFEYGRSEVGRFCYPPKGRIFELGVFYLAGIDRLDA